MKIREDYIRKQMDFFGMQTKSLLNLLILKMLN